MPLHVKKFERFLTVECRETRREIPQGADEIQFKIRHEVTVEEILRDQVAAGFNFA